MKRIIIPVLMLLSSSLLSCNKQVDYTKLVVSCMGDSITYGTAPDKERIDKPYPTILKETFNFKEVHNYGIPGSTVSNGKNSYEPMVDRLLNIDKDSNLIIFYGGGNDRGRDCETGKEGDKDSTSLYGALYQVGVTLTTTFKTAKSMFITPLPTKYDQGTYHEVRDAVVYTAKQFNIPCLDMFYDEEFPKEWEKSFSDWIHPSQDYVDKVLAPKIINFIKENIKF